MPAKGHTKENRLTQKLYSARVDPVTENQLLRYIHIEDRPNAAEAVRRILKKSLAAWAELHPEPQDEAALAQERAAVEQLRQLIAPKKPGSTGNRGRRGKRGPLMDHGETAAAPAA